MFDPHQLYLISGKLVAAFEKAEKDKRNSLDKKTQSQLLQLQKSIQVQYDSLLFDGKVPASDCQKLFKATDKPKLVNKILFLVRASHPYRSVCRDIFLKLYRNAGSRGINISFESRLVIEKCYEGLYANDKLIKFTSNEVSEECTALMTIGDKHEAILNTPPVFVDARNNIALSRYNKFFASIRLMFPNLNREAAGRIAGALAVSAMAAAQHFDLDRPAAVAAMGFEVYNYSRNSLDIERFSQLFANSALSGTKAAVKTPFVLTKNSLAKIEFLRKAKERIPGEIKEAWHFLFDPFIVAAEEMRLGEVTASLSSDALACALNKASNRESQNQYRTQITEAQASLQDLMI